jgi:hypothetical protein
MTTLLDDDEDNPFDERGVLKDGRSLTVRMSMRDGGDNQRQRASLMLPGSAWPAPAGVSCPSRKRRQAAGRTR